MNSGHHDHVFSKLNITENDIDLHGLLYKLFETQQLANDYHEELAQAKSDNEFYIEQIKRLSLAVPSDWTDEKLEFLNYTETNATSIWHVVLQNTAIAETYVNKLNFYITSENGVAGIRINNMNENVRAVRFPFKTETTGLFLQPQAGSLTHTSNMAISNLSPDAWMFFCSLVHKLKKHIDDIDLKSACPNQPYLSHSINNTLKALEAWPLMLRYTSADLVQATDTDSEFELHIRLTNLKLGDHHWDSLTYVLCTKNGHHSHFGSDPKLRFPPETRRAFDYWPVGGEASTSLEFSFRTNEAFESVLWDTLTDKDRLLLASLASSLPRQLDMIEKSGTALPKGVLAWTMIAQRIKYVLNAVNASRLK